MIGTTLIPLNSHTGKWANVVAKSLRLSDNIYSDFGMPKTLSQINSTVNKSISYKTEELDYWKSPTETLGDGHGDCEDQAILKMALMMKAGYDPEKIFLVVGYDQIARRDHAFVAYKENGDYLILDNHRDSIFKDKEYVSFFKPKISYTISKTYLHGTPA